MRFAFTEDQRLFRDAVRDMLAGECTPEAVRDAWTNDTGRIPGLWSALGSLGVLGLTASEDRGGLGMNEVDLVLPLEECGRAALPEPIVESTAVTIPLLAELGPGARAVAEEWIPRIAAGDATVAVGLTDGALVANADSASLLLLERDGALYAMPAAVVTIRRQSSVDGSRRLFALEWSAPAANRIAGGDEAAAALERARARAAVGTGAQLLGLASRMLEMTVEYAKVREQFGKPIGSFQALKHQLSDALMALEMARPFVYRAAVSLASGSVAAAVHASMAKLRAASAAHAVGRTALQAHGAIGYSFEYDLHLWMKRVWSLESAFGTIAEHRARVAAAVLDGEGPDLGCERVA